MSVMHRESKPPGKAQLRRSLAEQTVWRSTSNLIANPRNVRRHSRKQIHKLASVLEGLGVFIPIVIDEADVILAGHGRLEAAKLLGMGEVPTLQIKGLSESEKRAFVLADNRLAEMSGWERDALKLELKELVELDYDIELTGFDTGNVDLILDDRESGTGEEEELPTRSVNPVARLGDVWRLGRHRLLCGDATKLASYEVLLDGCKADLVFTDPPYNVPINGHVSGLGKARHREFAMATGEMSAGQFTRFLAKIFGCLADTAKGGAIVFVCMDWRHLYEVLSAGREIYALKNICVWNKSNAGMGSLYRSKHELVLVFQNGTGKFTNNVSLGATGRYRTNVWDYAGMTSMHKGRSEALEMHPTVKPVALVADAIRDCSRRNELILDPFSGSGTTIMACERTGRVAAAMEIDPAYVDVAIKRWEATSGRKATLEGIGQTFEAVAAQRLGAPVEN